MGNAEWGTLNYGDDAVVVSIGIWMEGTISSGSQDSSRSWDFEEIESKLNDPSICHGTVNIKLDDFPSFEFERQIPFPEHCKRNGQNEGLQFQRCIICVGEREFVAYVARTDQDHWSTHGIIEVIAPFIDGVSPGGRAKVKLLKC